MLRILEWKSMSRKSSQDTAVRCYRIDTVDEGQEGFFLILRPLHPKQNVSRIESILVPVSQPAQYIPFSIEADFGIKQGRAVSAMPFD